MFRHRRNESGSEDGSERKSGGRKVECPLTAVTMVVDGTGMEEIDPERIILPPGDLCQGFETDEEKKLNDQLMKDVRDQVQYPIE